MPSPSQTAAGVDSNYAWLRLALSMLIGTVSGAGMWSYVVSLPAVQADFGVTRAEASLPYTLMMLGFALGTVVMGRIVDRFGIVVTLLTGAVSIGIGYIGAGYAPSLTVFAIFHILIGLGSACGFGPLISDISHWFERRRGIAVGICAAGNYFAGALWPPVIQYFLTHGGWRPTHIGIGIFCTAMMFPLAFLLRRRMVTSHAAASAVPTQAGELGLSPGALQMLLAFAGVACCVAMSMPQVHLVAYCRDLGYGVARGSEMLSIMMVFGIVSRIGSGFIADRVGGLRTLLLGSFLQGVALLLYAFFSGLESLYIISALFGLFQGGIVLCHHRAGIFLAARSRCPAWRCSNGNPVRHGVRRLGVGLDLRSHRVVSRGVPEWTRLEPAQRRHRVMAYQPARTSRPGCRIKK